MKAPNDTIPAAEVEQTAAVTGAALPLAFKGHATDTPFFVTDLAIIRKQIALFKEKMPNVAIYYAIKANNAPEIIEAIDDLVEGYDIASLGEADQLIKAKVDPARMMYGNPVKIPRYVKQAFTSGVKSFAFDSIAEIQKIQEHAPGADVYLRLRVSDYGSKFPLSKKFGVDPLHAVDFCAMARDAGLQVKGLTFHVGSQSENLQVWKTAIESAGKVIKKLQKADFDLEFLDLGGGFPAEYGEPIPELADVAEVINKAVKLHIPKHLKLIAEPGRFIVATSTTLATTVIGREHRSGSDWLYLDVGTFQGLIEPLEIPGMKYPISTDKDHPSSYRKNFVLTGPSCDACDTIGLDYNLPSDISVGDRVYIGSAGAYTKVYASNFNGLEIPPTYFVDSEQEEA